MAQLELVLQAVTGATHAGAIRRLLDRIAADSVLISVGFIREAGVEAIEEALRPVAARTRFFVGIRNDITSIQGVKRLLRLGAQVYAVDTGSRDTIFHPKLYLVIDANHEAGLIVGSANLTHQGLHNNIEASALVTLDLAENNDQRFLEQIIEAFKEMLRAYPRHVFSVDDEDAADSLFQEGRLADEAVVPAPLACSTFKQGRRDSLPRMGPRRVPSPRLRAAVRRPAAHGGVPPTPPIVVLPVWDYYLVWKSKALKERDLNVPTGLTTHRTGSMLWKKGSMEGVDQRKFFRDAVFDGLAWTPDPRHPHLERARASFELVIKNVNYGKFMLQLTHNTRRDTKSYRQKNAMTQLHWGLALQMVARRDLLGRTMYLYRKDTNPPEFMIEID